MALGTTFTVNPSSLHRNRLQSVTGLPFIAITATSSTMLVVHPSIPVNSVAEFVAFAKKEAVAYAHGGNGTPAI
jgi:tripartite-type tricarboxylate transporter receptor subunit TctC